MREQILKALSNASDSPPEEIKEIISDACAVGILGGASNSLVQFTANVRKGSVRLVICRITQYKFTTNHH
jgi:hypothetical protein